MDPSVRELLSFGALGVVLALLLLGWLHTKPYVDYLVKKITAQDALIAQQSETNKTLADALERELDRRIGT